MATMIKGLQYFPLSVDFLENDKILLIISDFGMASSAVILKLLCKIYKNSFYIDWDDRICKVFSCTFPSGYSSDEIQKIVDSLLKEGIFDKDLYNKYHILTSEEIQICFFTAITKRRNKSVDNPEYLTEKVRKMYCGEQKHKNVPQSEEIAPQNAKIVPQNEQSKVKKSKVKESIVKESKVKNLYSSSSSSACACAREANGVIVSEEEIKKPNSFSENCKKWNAELMKDEEWLSSVVRSSGKGSPVLRLLPEIMEYFEQHIVSIGETGSMLNINDYKRRLINWWRYLKFQSVPEILEQQNSKPRKNREEKKSKVDEAMECAQKASVIAQRLLDGGGL